MLGVMPPGRNGCFWPYRRLGRILPSRGWLGAYIRTAGTGGPFRHPRSSTRLRAGTHNTSVSKGSASGHMTGGDSVGRCGMRTYGRRMSVSMGRSGGWSMSQPSDHSRVYYHRPNRGRRLWKALKPGSLAGVMRRCHREHNERISSAHPKWYCKRAVAHRLSRPNGVLDLAM